MKKFVLIVVSILFILPLLCNNAIGKTVKLESEKGIKFKADFYEAETPRSPAVLILPGRSGKRIPYQDFARQLRKTNINVMVISYYKLSTLSSNTKRKQWQKVFEKRGETMGLIENEVTTALNFLRSHQKVDPDRIGLLGASMGTWIGFVTMSQFTDLKGLVMLSPRCAVSGKSYNTYEGTPDLVNAFGERHLLLIGAEQDRSSSKFPTAVEASNYLIEVMPNTNITKKYYPGKSHSFYMLKDHKDLPKFIIQWFQETL